MHRISSKQMLVHGEIAKFTLQQKRVSGDSGR